MSIESIMSKVDTTTHVLADLSKEEHAFLKRLLRIMRKPAWQAEPADVAALQHLRGSR